MKCTKIQRGAYGLPRKVSYALSCRCKCTRDIEEQGFEELSEGSSWNLKDNGKYFVVRNESSVLAFRLPKNNFKGFQIASAHTDSPCFKIKAIA